MATVRDLQELLIDVGIPFSDFQESEDGGAVSWIRPSTGQRVRVAVWDVQIKQNLNTLETLKTMAFDFAISPRHLWWLAGEDVFRGMVTGAWKNYWQELPQNANLLIFERPMHPEEALRKGIGLERSDPLRGIFPENFLSQFVYRGLRGGHEYAGQNGVLNIYGIPCPRQPIVSSTAIRQVIQAHDIESLGRELGGNVFRSIREMGLYLLPNP